MRTGKCLASQRRRKATGDCVRGLVYVQSPSPTRCPLVWRGRGGGVNWLDLDLDRSVGVRERFRTSQYARKTTKETLWSMCQRVFAAVVFLVHDLSMLVTVNRLPLFQRTQSFSLSPVSTPLPPMQIAQPPLSSPLRRRPLLLPTEAWHTFPPPLEGLIIPLTVPRLPHEAPLVLPPLVHDGLLLTAHRRTLLLAQPHTATQHKAHNQPPLPSPLLSLPPPPLLLSYSLAAVGPLDPLGPQSEALVRRPLLFEHTRVLGQLTRVPPPPLPLHRRRRLTPVCSRTGDATVKKR